MVMVIAAGVVALFAAGVLAVNYVKAVLVEPDRQANIFELKKIIADQPNNDALIELLRQKDLEFRQGYFIRQRMSRKAAVILCVAVAALIGAMKFGRPRRSYHPSKERGDISQQQLTDAMLARRLIVSAAVVLAAVSVGVVMRNADFGNTETGKPKQETKAYPDMEEIYRNWPAFRGPAGNGVSAFDNVPVRFDIESGDNVVWKSEVPKFGNSSPIVWDNRVFVTGGDNESKEVICYDAADGNLLWRKEVIVTGAPEAIEVMEDTGYAASTPVTDGRRVYAIFATGETAAFDFQGNKVWTQFLGFPETAYGYASSLAIYEGTVIVQFDQGYEPGVSKLIGMEGATGRIVWQTQRNVPNSWTSPIVAKVADGYQVITVADPFVTGYDPADGSEIWSVEAVAGDVAPLPIVVNNVVYAVEPDYAVIAIKPAAKAGGGAAEVLWTVQEGAGDISSPASDGKRIYIASGKNLTCIGIESRQVLWENKFEDMVIASPSIVGDKVYIVDNSGTVIVFEAGGKYVKLEESRLGEKCYASPAFADGRIYLRGEKNLYCIGAGK